MEPKKDKKGSFEERLEKVEETLESIISTLKKIVGEKEPEAEEEKSEP